MESSNRKGVYATRQSQEIVSPKPDLHLHSVMIGGLRNRQNNPKVAVRAANNKTQLEESETKPASALMSEKKQRNGNNET